MVSDTGNGPDPRGISVERSAEIEGLVPSSGTGIAAFFGSAEFFDLTAARRPAGV